MTEMTTEQAIKLATSIPIEERITEMRNARDALRESYDTEPSIVIRSDIGREINRINDDINEYTPMSSDRKAIGNDYAIAAQILDSDVHAMKGEVDRIGAEDDKISRLAMELENGIEDYTDMVSNLLPGEFNTPDELAKFARKLPDAERENWYNPDGSIKDMFLNEMKYGMKGVNSTSVIEEGGKILKDGTAIKKCNVCRTDISNAGKKPMLDSGEIKNISMLNSPEKIIAAIEEKCNVNRTRAYKSAMRNISPNMQYMPYKSVYDLFDDNKEMPYDMVKYGYEHMALLLKDIFGERSDKFSIDDYTRMSKYDNVHDLADDINRMWAIDDINRIWTISNEDIEDAFIHKIEIEKGIPGSGRKYITEFLKDIFEERFDDDDYVRMSNYDDVNTLVEDINETCLAHGIYDVGLIDYGINQIDESAITNVGSTIDELDRVFGDQFTKYDYANVAKSIVDIDGVISSNKDNLMSQFRSASTDRQIRAGKLIKGIKSEDYNEIWDKKRQRLIKGNVVDVETRIKEDQLDDARDIFNHEIDKIDTNELMYRDSINAKMVNMGLQDNIVKRIMIGIVDLDGVIDDNRKGINSAMKRLVNKHDMLHGDVFSEIRLDRAVRERDLKEMGDPKRARDYMQNAILDVVSGIDMNEYEKSLSDMCCERIDTEFDSIRDVVDDFTARKESFIEMTTKKIHDIAEDAIETLYASEIDETSKAHDKELDEAEILEETRRKAKEDYMKEKRIKAKESSMTLMPFSESEIEAAKIYHLGEHRPKLSPAMKVRDNKFSESGLVMKKAVNKNEYRVYGKEDKYITFKDVKTLDKWFKDHYGGKK